MKILSVTISNILSIEKIDLVFEDNGLVLLEGWNHDDNKANGAGKTAIFNAISYGLYGKLPRRVTATEILKNGAKSGFVTVEVFTGTDTFTVTRHRPKTLVIFEKNGSKIDITQEEFESNIRLTYDQFLISMYTAQSTESKFINLNDSGKKEFLLKLLSLSEFTACKKDADEQWTTLEKELEKLNSKLEANTAKVDAYLESIDNQQELQKKIQVNKESIKSSEAKIIELQKVSKPDISRYITLEAELRTKRDTILEAKIKTTGLSIQHNLLAKQDVDYVPTKPDANCPHCLGALKIRNSTLAKADDIKAMKAQHENHRQTIKKDMAALMEEIKILEATAAKETELAHITKKLKERKEKELEEYTRATNRIVELRTFISTKEDQNKMLGASFTKTVETAQKIELLIRDNAELHQQITNNNILLDIFRTVSQLYSPTGAQAYILDSIIDSFNESVTNYISMIWPNASYQLRSYKENVRGDIVAKFSEELIISGKNHSIGSLSGGELRCLSLCVDFAVIDILSKQFGMRLNPIVMDEPFEGLDAASRETVIDLLEKMAVDRQIWVIDHASEVKAMFTKIVKVEKKSGTSTLMI